MVELPDDILARILLLVDKRFWVQVMRVCKGWRHLLFSRRAAVVWSRFSLDPHPLFPQIWWPGEPYSRRSAANAWFASKRMVLANVSSMVEALEVNCSSDIEKLLDLSSCESVAGLMCMLQPSMLQELRLHDQRQVPASAIHLLSYFTQLTILQLDSPYLPKGAAASIVVLRQLRKLTCHVYKLPDDLLRSIAALDDLQVLDLGFWSYSESMPVLQHLEGSLHHLQELRIRDGSCQDVWNPQAQQWEIRATAFPMPSSFPALQSFDYQAEQCLTVSDHILSGLRCHFTASHASNQHRSLALDLRGVQHAQALLPLVRMADPDCMALERLEVQDSPLRPGTWVARSSLGRFRGAVLPSVRSLRLDGCGGAGDASAIVSDFLQLLPGLEELVVVPGADGDSLSTLPLSLQSRSGLKRLALPGHTLSVLPAGAYLTGLELLDLTDCRLSTLPPALSTASALSRLVLSHNTELAVTQEQLGGMLSRLPRLRQLGLEGTNTPAAVLVAASSQVDVLLPAGDVIEACEADWQWEEFGAEMGEEEEEDGPEESQYGWCGDYQWCGNRWQYIRKRNMDVTVWDSPADMEEWQGELEDDPADAQDSLDDAEWQQQGQGAATSESEEVQEVMEGILLQLQDAADEAGNSG